MTFLWVGLAFVALFVVFMLWLVVLGLKQRAEDRREIERDAGRVAPFLRSRFEPFVPPQQPHRPWSDMKDDREPDA